MTWVDWALFCFAIATAAAMGWLYRADAISTCGELVHSDQALCRELGGNMADDADGPTVCLFTCSDPP